VAQKYSNLWHNQPTRAPPKSLAFCPTCWWSYEQALTEIGAENRQEEISD